MKFRSDFVTNSSSSSYIVYFNELPRSAEDVYRQAFLTVDGTVKEQFKKYGEQELEDAAKSFFRSIEFELPNNYEAAAHEEGGGYDSHSLAHEVVGKLYDMELDPRIAYSYHVYDSVNYKLPDDEREKATTAIREERKKQIEVWADPDKALEITEQVVRETLEKATKLVIDDLKNKKRDKLFYTYSFADDCGVPDGVLVLRGLDCVDLGRR